MTDYLNLQNLCIIVLHLISAIMESYNDGKIASMISVESGHSIGTSLAVLRMFHRLGAISLTLTHNCNTPWYVYIPFHKSATARVPFPVSYCNNARNMTKLWGKRANKMWVKRVRIRKLGYANPFLDTHASIENALEQCIPFSLHQSSKFFGP